MSKLEISIVYYRYDIMSTVAFYKLSDRKDVIYMASILDILVYFGYPDPIKAYQSLTLDKLMYLIHRYYELNK